METSYKQCTTRIIILFTCFRFPICSIVPQNWLCLRVLRPHNYDLGEVSISTGNKKAEILKENRETFDGSFGKNQVGGLSCDWMDANTTDFDLNAELVKLSEAVENSNISVEPNVNAVTALPNSSTAADSSSTDELSHKIPPSFHLVFDSVPNAEIDSDEETDEEELLAKGDPLACRAAELLVQYQEKEAVAAASEQNEKYETEKYECDTKRVFLTFQRALNKAPGHVLRYEFGGKPIWMADDVVLDADLIPSITCPQVTVRSTSDIRIPNCPRCGKSRVFEFQLHSSVMDRWRDTALLDTSTAVRWNETKKERETLYKTPEWGVIAFYTCSGDCTVEVSKEFCNSDVATEWAVVQMG
eukprot:GHVR01169526.1.p1 GENE.GHVR01169526.1~~GHVR01169526.1.p1  ORF type:complete len:358 (+),score=31.51 GHVR01169526.1:249-1322(+)